MPDVGRDGSSGDEQNPVIPGILGDGGLGGGGLNVDASGVWDGGGGNEGPGTGGGDGVCGLPEYCGGGITGSWEITDSCVDQRVTLLVAQSIWETLDGLEGCISVENVDSQFRGTGQGFANGEWVWSAYTTTVLQYLQVNLGCPGLAPAGLSCEEFAEAVEEEGGDSDFDCSDDGSGCRCTVTYQDSELPEGWVEQLDQGYYCVQGDRMDVESDEGLGSVTLERQ